MKYTKNYNLNLPDLTDQYNLKHWNENTEKIDDKLNEHQMKLDASTSETTPSSLMMRNEQGKVKVSTPLEQDDTNMAVNIDYLMNAFRTKMLDESHPKGDYYWTDDKNFDPNVSWVGTWVRVEDTFIYAIGESENADGVIRGSKKITVQNLPPHTHDKGTLTVDLGGKHTHSINFKHKTASGSYGHDLLTSKENGGSGFGAIYQTDSDTSAHYHTISGSTSDGGFANEDYMPPYIGAYCWHRTE